MQKFLSCPSCFAGFPMHFQWEKGQGIVQASQGVVQHQTFEGKYQFTQKCVQMHCLIGIMGWLHGVTLLSKTMVIGNLPVFVYTFKRSLKSPIRQPYLYHGQKTMELHHNTKFLHIHVLLMSAQFLEQLVSLQPCTTLLFACPMVNKCNRSIQSL